MVVLLFLQSRTMRSLHLLMDFFLNCFLMKTLLVYKFKKLQSNVQSRTRGSTFRWKVQKSHLRKFYYDIPLNHPKSSLFTWWCGCFVYSCFCINVLNSMVVILYVNSILPLSLTQFYHFFLIWYAHLPVVNLSRWAWIMNSMNSWRILK